MGGSGYVCFSENQFHCTTAKTEVSAMLLIEDEEAGQERFSTPMDLS